MNRFLQQFADWLQEQDKAFDPQEVAAITIQDYRSYMMNTLDQKPATINKALATLKTFFTWAVEQKLVASDPSSTVRVKRVQQGTAPKWMTDQGSQRPGDLLHDVSGGTAGRGGQRFEADAHGPPARTNDRYGRQGREVPSRADALRTEKALKAWMAFRNASGKSFHQDSEYLFVSERSGKMTTRAIEYMMDTYLKRCGLLERDANGKKLDGQHSCHSLRHTFGKRLVDAGHPLNEVK